MILFCFIIAQDVTLMDRYAQIQKVLSREVIFFGFDEGRNNQNTTISGPSLARQQNSV